MTATEAPNPNPQHDPAFLTLGEQSCPEKETGRDLLVRLGYDVPENEMEYLRKTFAYYCQRTLHSAALSFTILVKVGQLCWKTDYVWDWFMEAVKTDLYDREGTTHLGMPGVSACDTGG